MFYHTLIGAKFGGKAKFDEICETTDRDTRSNNLLTFPTHSSTFMNSRTLHLNMAINLI